MSQAPFPLRTLSSDDMLDKPARPNPFMKNKGKAPERQLFDQSPSETPLKDREPDEPQYKLRPPTPARPAASAHGSPTGDAAPKPTIADIRASAAGALTAGNKPRDVEQAIVQRCGLSPQEAHAIVHQAQEDVHGFSAAGGYATVKRRSCIRHLILGSLWFVGGVGVTVGSFVLSGHGGYVLAYGAIIIGALEATYGFFGTIYYSLKK